MKTENAPSQGNKLFAAIGVFAMSALLAFGATSTPAGNFKSTPYQNRSATADQTLDRLTGAQGRTILDGVVTRVKQKAADKAGNPPNAAAYNAYLDAYLAKVDQLDNTTRASLGRDYEFLFQYIYPRVYEGRMSGTAVAVSSETTSCQAGFLKFPNNPNSCYDTRNCSSWSGYSCNSTSGNPICPTGYHIVSGTNYCAEGAGDTSANAAPVFNFTTSEYSVAAGASVKLNWYQMMDVVSCVAGGDWSGTKPVA